MMLKKEDANTEQTEYIRLLEMEYTDPTGAAHFTADRVAVDMPGFRCYDFAHGALVSE